MKKVGILHHPLVEATRRKAEELEKVLESRGVEVWSGSAWDTEQARARMDDTGLLLTVGGDGTILRAVQAVIPAKIPIAGVNLGKLGFMTEVNGEEAQRKLPYLLGGECRIDERTMLQVELASSGGETRTFHALNDAVVARGEIVRVIYVEAVIDGQHLTTYKADGVIMATATGSTGYALAAGGPIMHPQSRDFLLLPVAAHLSSAYSIVVPGEAEVRLRVKAVHPATISIDGHINLPLSNDDVITIKRSPYTVRFLRIRHENSFYATLEERLRGKQVAPGRES